MTRVDFVVTEVFDLAERAGLLVVGRLLRGQVASGVLLHDEESLLPVHVLGIELHGGANPRTTLIVDRADSVQIRVGRRLIGD